MSEKVKYFWYFLTFRPYTEKFEDCKFELLEWCKEQSTSLYIMEEDCNHWHIVLCLKYERSRSSLQQTYKRYLQSFDMSGNELIRNTNQGAIRICYNSDLINNYLSGSYIKAGKNKAIRPSDIIYNNIENDDYHKFKEVERTSTYQDKRVALINKAMDLLEIENFDFEDPYKMLAWYDKCLINGEFAISSSEYQKLEFIRLIYIKKNNKYFGYTWKEIIKNWLRLLEN